MCIKIKIHKSRFKKTIEVIIETHPDKNNSRPNEMKFRKICNAYKL